MQDAGQRWTATDPSPVRVGRTRGLSGPAAERFRTVFITRGGARPRRRGLARRRGQREETRHICLGSGARAHGGRLPAPLSPLRRERPRKESCHP